MEKLKSVKKDKNKTINKNLINNINSKKDSGKFSAKKKKQPILNFLKNNQLFNIVKQNWIKLVIVLSLVLLTIFFAFIMFYNNSYYNYINRPKILKSSIVIIVNIIIATLLTFGCFMYNLIINAKVFTNKNNQKNIIKQLQDNNFVFAILSVLLTLLLCLFFKLELLWLCVVIMFFVCFIKVLLVIKNKFKSRYINLVELMANLCLLLSIYYIYLLN